MIIRLTPIVAMAMAMSLSACQEEESPAPEETTSEEVGNASGGDAASDSAAGSEMSGGQSAGSDTDMGSEGMATSGSSGSGGQSAGAESGSGGQSAGATSTEDSAAANVEESTTDTGAASQDATDAAQMAAQDGDSPAAAAQDDAEQAAELQGTVGAESADQMPLEEALTPEGFDAERIRTAIDEADLDESRKEELRNLVETASGNPMEEDAALNELSDALLSQDGANAGDAIGGTEQFAAAPGSLFTPASFGGSSDFAITGADLGAANGTIFPADAVTLQASSTSAWVDAETGELVRVQTIRN